MAKSANRVPRRQLKSNAQRQAEYRQRHLFDPETVDGARLNLVVSLSAKAQLRRLAIHSGVTQRAMLSRLLAAAENDVVSLLRGDNQTAYYDGKNVTP